MISKFNEEKVATITQASNHTLRGKKKTFLVWRPHMKILFRYPSQVRNQFSPCPDRIAGFWQVPAF
jgi:hypothetical protein